MLDVIISLISATSVSVGFSYFLKLFSKYFKDTSRTKVKINDKVLEIKLSDIDKSLELIRKELINYKNNPSVFFSYSSKDKDIAQKIVKDLESIGIEVWTDTKIEIGESITKAIENGINSSQWFLILITPNSLESNWTKRELQVAQNLEISRESNLIIPIVYNTKDVPESLKHRKYVDLSKNYEHSIDSISNLIMKHAVINKMER